jgi:hypothetical protein
MTSGEYEEGDLSGLIDLIEVIRIQDTGPTEAARAIRKKLYELIPRLSCFVYASSYFTASPETHIASCGL